MDSRIELMLAADQDLSPETRKDLLVLQRNIERASRISRNMLSLARQRPGERVALDMNVAVEEAMLIVGAEARADALKFEIQLDRSLPSVMGELTGLEQVIINLVMNARDAGAHLVRIETSRVPSRVDQLRLSISDDGSGIESESLRRLFEPFFTTKPKGTGLGLWLSQRIIQDHGGTITSDSAPGKGTTFTITLPTIDQSALPTNDHPAHPDNIELSAQQPASAQTLRFGK
jgi:signal transduction histidine kinase